MNDEHTDFDTDDRPTLIPTGDVHDTDRAPPPDFSDADAGDEVHLFV